MIYSTQRYKCISFQQPVTPNIVVRNFAQKNVINLLIFQLHYLFSSFQHLNCLHYEVSTVSDGIMLTVTIPHKMISLIPNVNIKNSTHIFSYNSFGRFSLIFNCLYIYSVDLTFRNQCKTLLWSTNSQNYKQFLIHIVSTAIALVPLAILPGKNQLDDRQINI